MRISNILERFRISILIIFNVNIPMIVSRIGSHEFEAL